jgi:hypothetical protein
VHHLKHLTQPVREGPSVQEFQALCVLRVRYLQGNQELLRQGQQTVEIFKFCVLRGAATDSRLQVPLEALVDQVCQLLI